MRKAIRFSVVVLSCAIASSCATPAQQGHAPSERVAEEIIALERSALDRYITADPQGYVDLYAQEVTYFDPTTEKRVDGLTAMQERMAPMKNLKLPFTDPRYEMNNPKVVQDGDLALLGGRRVEARGAVHLLGCRRAHRVAEREVEGLRFARRERPDPHAAVATDDRDVLHRLRPLIGGATVQRRGGH